MNTYGYVGGNPLYWVDPKGLKELSREELLELSQSMTEPWMDILNVVVGGGLGSTKLLLKKGVSNKSARQWYDKQVKKININLKPTRQNARNVCEKRNLLKKQTRDMMEDQNLRKQLDKNKPIESFESYMKKYSAEGFKGDKLWKRIMEGSITPNKIVNKSLGL